jgi:hypothetical protein
MMRAASLNLCAFLCVSITLTVSVRASQDTASTRPTALFEADTSGEEIYRQACAACHSIDGAGQPQSVVGFPLPLANGHTFPDFNDCGTNTVEPFADWVAVVHRGGPVRALDRRMPAFGDALTPDQIERAVKHIWTFCNDPSWPRGDLNLPRTFFTEKAFPENEAVWTTGVTGSGAKAISNELVYEHRIGSRAQYEVKLPITAAQQEPGGAWSRGIGDVEFAVKQAFYANLDRGSIFAAGGAIIAPTGKENEGLGNGYWIYEPFAMWGQIIGSNGFLHVHAGVEFPSNQDLGDTESFVRTAVGYTFAQDQGFGRAWSPMVEVLTANPQGAAAEWDVVPQVQVSLSKLQHVLLNVGVRVPLNERDDRKPEFLTYVLWDWFDGGLFQFWK